MFAKSTTCRSPPLPPQSSWVQHHPVAQQSLQLLSVEVRDPCQYYGPVEPQRDSQLVSHHQQQAPAGSNSWYKAWYVACSSRKPFPFQARPAWLVTTAWTRGSWIEATLHRQRGQHYSSENMLSEFFFYVFSKFRLGRAWVNSQWLPSSTLDDVMNLFLQSTGFLPFSKSELDSNCISGFPGSDWSVLKCKYIPIHSLCICMYSVCIGVYIQNPKSVFTSHVLTIHTCWRVKYRLSTHQYKRCLHKYRLNTNILYPNTIRPLSILTNTYQYTGILANASWMDWSVLWMYWNTNNLYSNTSPFQYVLIHTNTHPY